MITRLYLSGDFNIGSLYVTIFAVGAGEEEMIEVVGKDAESLRDKVIIIRCALPFSTTLPYPH